MFLSREWKAAGVFGEKILRSPKMNTSCSEIKKKSIITVTQNSGLRLCSLQVYTVPSFKLLA